MVISLKGGFKFSLGVVALRYPLMSTNVKSSFLKEADLLIYSSCMDVEYLKVVEGQILGKVGLHVCLQEHHMDSVGFKVATIMRESKPRSIAILTMNGSPHCIQLHMAVEQARKLVNYQGALKHLVVERGEILEASSEAVKIARHLAMVEKLFGAQRN